MTATCVEEVVQFSPTRPISAEPLRLNRWLQQAYDRATMGELQRIGMYVAWAKNADTQRGILWTVPKEDTVWDLIYTLQDQAWKRQQQNTYIPPAAD